MDPKTLSNLDPKLRETYERVMGSASAAAPGSTPGATAPGTPSPEPTLAPPTPAADSPIPTPSSAHVTEPTLSPSPTPVAPSTEPNPFQTPVMQAAEQPPLQSPASVNQMSDQNASPMIRILYIVGAIVFFIVYTFFWAKVFNLQWPF